MSEVDADRGKLRSLAAGFKELRFLALHGSRARGDAHPRSDWDFAYRADPGLDVLSLQAALADALSSDNVDVADVDRAGAVLRHRVAQEGKLVFERKPGEFADFRYDAILFWLDAGPIIRAENEAILVGLG
jgi:predicted nucleotidyltransferase